MAYVEDAKELRAKGYARPLKYTMERSLGGGLGAFRYIFDQGALRCSASAEHRDRACYVARDTQTTLARESPSFLYVDVGCWVDDADGKGARHRDFALICGPNVYLCQYTGGGMTPSTRIPAVRDFFVGLAERGGGTRVVQYSYARDLDRKTIGDPSLYVILGDLHLPPVTWFYSNAQIAFPAVREIPDWLAQTPAMLRQKNWFLRDYYGKAAHDRETGQVPGANSPIYGHPDIFGHAGAHLVHFISALTCLDESLRKRLHFIHTGDMFELWVGRDYQLMPGEDGKPRWKDHYSPERVADWALEVIIQNTPVFSALRRMEDVGLAEVRYIGGNHDGYLMKEDMALQLTLPVREPIYRGLNGDLMVEHGHRFDGSNFDNVNGQEIASGPWVTELLHLLPGIRKYESVAGARRVLTNPSERDGYLLGATLHYLSDRFQAGRKPFGIYVMGHTHEPMMVRFDVRAEYTSTNHEEATTGETRP